MISNDSSLLQGRFEIPDLLFELVAEPRVWRISSSRSSEKQGEVASTRELEPKTAYLFLQTLGFRLEEFSFRFQLADVFGFEGCQRLAQRRQLGTPPIVFPTFLVLFPPEPVELATELVQLRPDRLALRPDRISLLTQFSQLGHEPIPLATDCLVLRPQAADSLNAHSPQRLAQRRQLGTPPIVFPTFLVLFPPEPVELATELLQLRPDRLSLLTQLSQLGHEPIPLATDCLVLRPQAADSLDAHSPQRLAQRRQLGTLPIVFPTFLVLFPPEPVDLTTELLQLRPDRLSLLTQFSQLGHEPIPLATDCLVLRPQAADSLNAHSPQRLAQRRQLGTPPIVFPTFLVLFPPEPVELTMELLQLRPDRLSLLTQFSQLGHEPIPLATDCLVLRPQAADSLNAHSPQRLAERRQLGTPPIVFPTFLVLFPPEPVELATELLQLRPDRLSLRPDRLSLLTQFSQLGHEPIPLATDCLVLRPQAADSLDAHSPQRLAQRRQLGTPPIVFPTFLVLFPPEPVELATELLQLRPDRLSLLTQLSQLGHEPIPLATDCLVLRPQAADSLDAHSPQRLAQRRQLGTPPIILQSITLTCRFDHLILAQQFLEFIIDLFAFQLALYTIVLECAELGEKLSKHSTDRIEPIQGRSPRGLARLPFDVSLFDVLFKLNREIRSETARVGLSHQLDHIGDQKLFFAAGAPNIFTGMN